VERPERVRAVKVGLAATVSRLEELLTHTPLESAKEAATDPDDLASALDRMKLDPKTKIPLQVIYSSATVNLLNDPAVKFVHGDIDGDIYLENLVEWVAASHDNVANNNSEIPDNMSQTDLFRKYSLKSCVFFRLI
jgi:histone deacetylase HOS3